MFTFLAVALCFNTSFVNPERLPLVVTPREEHRVKKSWSGAERKELRELLQREGALLFRGWNIETPQAFVSLITAVLDKPPTSYKGGEGSRKKVIEGVYTSTEAGPDFKIPLHNELSCTSNPPCYFSFYCEIAPLAGTGQTLLARTDEVTQKVRASSLWKAYEGRLLKYTSRHPSRESLFCALNPTHKSWQEAFETEDPHEVEALCLAKGFEWRWLASGLEVNRYALATRLADAHFSSPYWFNQVHLYHPNPTLHGGYLNDFLVNLVYMEPHTQPYGVSFADGTPISKELVEPLYALLDAATIYFDWQKGDVLILDNFRVMHGRAPYASPRRVLAAFTP